METRHVYLPFHSSTILSWQQLPPTRLNVRNLLGPLSSASLQLPLVFLLPVVGRVRRNPCSNNYTTFPCRKVFVGLCRWTVGGTEGEEGETENIRQSQVDGRKGWYRGQKDSPLVFLEGSL